MGEVIAGYLASFSPPSSNRIQILLSSCDPTLPVPKGNPVPLPMESQVTKLEIRNVGISNKK